MIAATIRLRSTDADRRGWARQKSPRMSLLSNRFGHFDPSGRAFTIKDAATPMPWVNVISNGRYGLVISQNGGGFSWFDDAQHNVITRWEMDLVRDRSEEHTSELQSLRHLVW